MKATRFGRVLVALTVLFAAACASGGAATQDNDAPPAAAATAAQVTVQNNRTGLSAINVFLVPEAGPQVSLGSVESQASQTFSRGVQPGFYRLRAQRTDGGADILSERFNFRNGQRVNWNMQMNSAPIVTNM